MEEYTPDTFKPLLAKLVKTPEYFAPDDLRRALEHLFIPDAAHPTQIGAFLTAMHIKQVERRPETLAAASSVLRARAIKVAIEDDNKDFVVDIVGTGGDGHDTFNVSTTAAVVAAGAGARVVKHGSVASTSKSGSADLLERLECLFVAPTAGTTMHIPRIPFTFILAPHYHPALSVIAPYRKLLPFRTLFNMIGPLTNPACPRGMVLGVAERDLGLPFAKSLCDSHVERALVVCGAEGLDEISCAGDTWVWELKDGNITETTLHPTHFGLRTHPLKSVSGGTALQNAETFKALLTSGSEIPNELTPALEFVLMNASALLVVAGIASDYKDGVRLAMESVTSGAAWKALEAFREAGRAAMAKVEREEK
ncbi:hypothetical protein PAXRUDRAFT_832146 [Paxillus rubicundulus Ve08.2h10]|uniref:Anthranilate phosphoribosyltransferase n=1 Tax=Paxillus rubicundulus Ve08.2h10 TaxID=930991 RepID=A0A0D0DEA7_9AGAM|nr:hypothetical protein PAXRUDRAFT_832146 [Paxillus rubicundulus Ve08.2h10]